MSDVNNAGKTNKWDMLSLLREYEGAYVSGEEISKKFSVTRAAVWKYVNELKNLGYKIESKTNNGYKILPSFDVLNEYEIKSRLKNKNLNDSYNVIYKASTDSTNNDAKKITDKNNIIIVASEQTAGKGRYGRTFYSDSSGGIYFSLKINRGNYENINLNIEDITFFPLIAAAAVSKAVYDLCGIELLIKWPNDLLYKTENTYKKLCGILTEASIEAENRSVSYVIVGIGLNVNNGLSDFPDEIKDIASSLKIISNISNISNKLNKYDKSGKSGKYDKKDKKDNKDNKYDRADIICEITDNFTRLMKLPRADLLEEYKKRLLLNIEISFMQNGELFRGKALGINGAGNLTAELENGEITTIQSGEIKFI